MLEAMEMTTVKQEVLKDILTTKMLTIIHHYAFTDPTILIF